MPTYVYACTACEHQFEVQQAFTEATLSDCPECTGRLRKLFNSVGIVFKGSGFYRTDSRTKGEAAKAKDGAKESAKDGSSTSTGSAGDTSSTAGSTESSSGAGENGSSGSTSSTTKSPASPAGSSTSKGSTSRSTSAV